MCLTHFSATVTSHSILLVIRHFIAMGSLKPFSVLGRILWYLACHHHLRRLRLVNHCCLKPATSLSPSLDHNIPAWIQGIGQPDH